ncbi:MAG: hypothetical protein WC359_15190, partial [Dehalococcoidia bacterium]
MADVRALIRELGQVRNALDADIIQIGGVDTGAAVILSIGRTNASGITIGQAGVTTTFPGDVDIEGVLTIVDGGSIIGDGDVTLGGGDGDTITLGGTFSTANDVVNIGTTAVGGDTVVNLRTNMGVGVGKRINFDRTADSESALLLPDTKDAPVGLAAGMVRVNGAGLLEWYNGVSWLTAAVITTYTLDEAYNASAGASLITVDAGDVTWAPTGAYSFVLDLTATTGASTDGFLIENGTDYFRARYAAVNALALSAELTSVGINTSDGVTFRANHASEFRVTGDTLTIMTVTSGTLAVTSAAILDMNGVAVTLDATGGFSIDGSGAVCNVSATSNDLTISTVTSGVLYLASAGLLTLTDGYKAASTWATDLVLSDAAAEWSTFETNFGEVSLLNALNQCATSVVTLDEAYNASSGASSITVDAGDVSWNLTGAFSIVTNLAGCTGAADGFFIEDGTDYLRLTHAAANTLNLTADFGSVNIGTSLTFDVVSLGIATISSPAGVGIISDANDAGANAITIRSTNVGAGTATLNIDAKNQIYVDAGGDILIGGAANTGAISLGNSASARTVTVGSTNTTSVLALQAGTGLISFTDGYKAGGGYAGALYLALNAAEYTTFEANFGEVSLLNAMNQCATSVVTLDEAYNASGGASLVTVDAGDVTWAQTGAYSFVVDLVGATGTADGFHVEDGTDYFRLNHTAANSLALSSEFTSVGINTSEGVTIRANHASEFRVTSNNLTLTTVTSGTLAVTSAAVLDLDGVAVTLDASGGFSIDGSGAACNVSATSQDLTLSTITAGTLAVSSAALLTLSDGYKAGSTYASDLVLSDSIVEWSAFDTAFGEVSLLNAVAGLKDGYATSAGNAATVTVADTASATCYVGLYEAAIGSLAGKTDAALTYNATTGALGATSMGVATGGAFTYNAISAVSAITAKNDWNFGGGGNLSMTAEQVVCIGPSAGAAVTNTGYSVYLGYSAASSVVGAYGNNVIIGCIAARDATSIKNSVVSGYAAGIGMNGNYDIAIGVSAGRYYGAGTDQNVSATQCVYLGGLSRAYASGDTNEIVIGYNAIGAGSNTATLGNTSITSTVLRGDVTGPTSYTATTAGVAKSVTDVLVITNSAHAADMDGTGTAILWNQWYYDAVTPAIA